MERTNRARFFTAFLLSLLSFLWGLPVTPLKAGEGGSLEGIPFDVNDLETIKTYYEELPGSSVREVVALAMIDAPSEVVWEVIADQQRLGKGSGLIDMKSVESVGDNLTEIYLILNLPWPLKDLDCRLLLSEDPKDHELTWRNTAGHIVRNTGKIKLRKVDGRTFIKFTLTLELGNVLPQRLVNWVVRQKLPGEIQLIRKAVASRK